MNWPRAAPLRPSLSDSEPARHHRFRSGSPVGRGGNLRLPRPPARHRGNRFEVSQTPVRVAIAKAPVECLVARGRCEPFAFVWTVEIKSGDVGESIAAAPLINPRVAPHGEIWIMLMQMIPSADAIGQTECEASRATGARTLETPAAFTQAAILRRASGSGSEGWKTRAAKFLAKSTICSPEPLAIEPSATRPTGRLWIFGVSLGATNTTGGCSTRCPCSRAHPGFSSIRCL
jgi:hypothetical protein